MSNIPTQQALQVYAYFRCPHTGILYQYPLNYRVHVLGPQIPPRAYFPQYFLTQVHANPSHNITHPPPPIIIQPLRQIYHQYLPPPTVNFRTPPGVTQLHVNPSHNVSLPPPPITQSLPQTFQTSPSTMNFAFGTPPGELLNADGFECKSQEQFDDESKTDSNDLLSQRISSLTIIEKTYFQSSVNLSQTQVENLPSDDYKVPARRSPKESKDINRQSTSSHCDLRRVDLTNFTREKLHKIFVNLITTDFASHANKKLDFNACTDAELRNPTSMSIVEGKLRRFKYTCLYEFVHDIRHIMSYLHPMVENYFKHLAIFRNKFDDLLDQEFPNLDFQYVTGNSKELARLLPLKEEDRKHTDEV